jgi:hypothetical protein
MRVVIFVYTILEEVRKPSELLLLLLLLLLIRTIRPVFHKC